MTDVYDKNGHIDIQYVLSHYTTFDEPIPYKEFLIYPVMVRDFNEFSYAYDVLDINKNDSGDIDIIQMSYLDFLVTMSFTEIQANGNSIVADKLSKILELTLKVTEEQIKIYQNETSGKWHLIINDKDVSSKDFDEIRRIILYQNLVGYDENDKYVDPSLRKAYDAYMQMQQDGNSEPSLEKQIASIQSHTGMLKKDLIEMTFRSFKILLNSCISEVDYMILKTAESGGMVKFKKPIDHWVYEKKNKDKYAQAFVSLDGYENKMRSVT